MTGACFHRTLLAGLDGPERRVLTDDRASWTNRELLDAAMRFAAGIRRRADGNRRPVAIVGTKSCEAVAAVIGALCAGRAFSTFDPIENAWRVRTRLAALRPSAIVDLDGLASSWDLHPLGPVVDALPALAPDHTQPDMAGDGLAYVLFTSGSTGAPRGVAVGHRAAVLARSAYLRAADIGHGDVVANDIPLIFDVSTLDVLGGLSAGAAVRLIPLSATEDSTELHDRLAACGATTSFTVPTVADLLFTDRAPPTSLRRIFLTGEKIGVRLHARLTRANVEVVNAYGMTEAPWVATGRLDYGRNVFDFPAPDDPVQVELARDGEIVLRGPGLHSVIAGPETDLATDPGPVDAYRTGDYANRVDGGRFRFLGRRDRHVRYEGYRIELGEIESIVEMAAPDVLAFATLDEEPGTLTVGIAPRPGKPAPDLQATRAAAEHMLPEFLSRLGWQALPRAPRTVTGKKDYREAAEHVGL